MGQVKLPVVDAVARAVDTFGNPTLDVYLFTRTLEPAVKTALAAQADWSFSKIAAKAGQSPVLNLQFYFEPDTTKCSTSKLMSYTATFEKSETFPYESGKDGPINFASDKAEGGVSDVTCKFEAGTPLKIRVRRTVTADQVVLPALLPPGKDKLVFSWDIELNDLLAKGK